MSIKILYVFIILFSLSALLKADNTSLSIDEQIEMIKKAPPKRRVELMNALKQKIAQMNQEQRAQTIKRLQGKMHSKKRATTFVQEPYPQTEQHISDIEHINQKQTKERYIQNSEHIENKIDMPNNKNMYHFGEEDAKKDTPTRR